MKFNLFYEAYVYFPLAVMKILFKWIVVYLILI